MNKESQRRVLLLARERGRRGMKFATQDESRVPGYNEAWLRGRIGYLIEDIVSCINESVQTNDNLYYLEKINEALRLAEEAKNLLK